VLWMTRIGLTLQFFSLWLVTPEILGREKMEKPTESVHRLLERLAKQVRSKPRALFPLAAKSTAYLTFFLFVVTIVSNFAPSPGMFDPTFGYVHHVPIKKFAPFAGTIIGFYIAFVITLYIVYFIIWVIGMMVEYSTKSLHVLAAVGAVLFTVGFIALLWATWIA
jgi:hypothetical protein